jgi:hypothetical protein
MMTPRFIRLLCVEQRFSPAAVLLHELVASKQSLLRLPGILLSLADVLFFIFVMPLL